MIYEKVSTLFANADYIKDQCDTLPLYLNNSLYCGFTCIQMKNEVEA